MNALYNGHRVHVIDDFGGTAGKPFGGVVLDTGERVDYGDPGYNPDPTDDSWFAAHEPSFVAAGPGRARCTVCQKLRR